MTRYRVSLFDESVSVQPEETEVFFTVPEARRFLVDALDGAIDNLRDALAGEVPDPNEEESTRKAMLAAMDYRTYWAAHSDAIYWSETIEIGDGLRIVIEPLEES